MRRQSQKNEQSRAERKQRIDSKEQKDGEKVAAVGCRDHTDYRVGFIVQHFVLLSNNSDAWSLVRLNRLCPL